MLRGHKVQEDNVVAIRRCPRVSVTLETVAEQYLYRLERRGASVFTIKHERECINAVLKHLPEDTPVDSLTSEQLEQQVFDVMRARNLKPNTVNGRIKTIRRVLGFAKEEGLVGTNAGYKLQKMIETNMGIPSFEEEQYLRILAQCDTTTFAGLRDRTIMALMLDNGIRLRELIDLDVEQVDLYAGVLKNVDGKTNTTDDLPLSKPMVRLLATYIRERGRFPTVSPALFVTLDGNRLNRSTLQKAIAMYGDRAGIENVRVSAHTFRHTFAKIWILNGGDPFTLKKILRHQTMDMVNRYIYLWGHQVAKRHETFSPLVGHKLL